MKKICLITTTQPAANPRLVKEADCLSAAGHDVTVLYCYVADWAQKADKEILSGAKWKYRQIGGTNKDSPAYKRTRIRFAFYRKINELSNATLLAPQAHARCYKELLKAAVECKADWYIGHNPGAMAIAANAAQKTDAKCGFDFEDYHRGEYADRKSPGFLRLVVIEQRYVRVFNYLTVASPLIGRTVEFDFSGSKAQVLLNTFSLNEQPSFKPPQPDDLHLFWFSQHIGKDRGLEIAVAALKELNDPSVHITLAGNSTEEMKNYFTGFAGAMSSNLHFAGVIPPKQLPEFSSHFDIGLATELDMPFNRSVCLTNKIFTYLLAGNAILFSRTAAQQTFDNQYQIGKGYEINDPESFMSALKYYRDKNMLQEQKKHNYTLASTVLNWETESKKLLQLIN